MSLYASHFWYEADVIAGAAFVSEFGNSVFDQPHSLAIRQEPAAQNDISELIVRLDPGDYRMSFVGIQTLNSGIQTVYFDNALVATFDWYGLGTAYGAVFSANVTVQDISIIVSSRTESKNGASSGWDIDLTRIWFDKVGI